MRIATFNINAINKRLPVLLAWLEAVGPDIVCLQELKCPQGSFPQEELLAAGYRSVWVAEGAWNGVAILARDADPVVTRSSLPDDSTDRQPRYIEAAVSGLLIGCLYAPNGNPQPGPKFDYKLAWTRRLIRHGSALMSTGLPVVLAGDYNIVPEPRDIYSTTSYDKNALVQPQSRALFAELLAQGWSDGLRAVYPDETLYTFWDYQRQRWKRDAGLRIDHLLVSPGLSGKIVSAGVDRAVRGLPGASDHAPAWIELAD